MNKYYKRRLEDYRNALISKNRIVITSITTLQPILVHNRICHPSHVKPQGCNKIVFSTWLEQWMALSSNHTFRYRCGACGRELFAFADDPECKQLAAEKKASGEMPHCQPEDFEAIAGLIKLDTDIYDGQNIIAYKGETFIVPMCKDCNELIGRSFYLKPNTTITPALERKAQHPLKPRVSGTFECYGS